MEEEKSTKKSYQSLLITVASILLVSFVIIMVNQVVQLVQVASAASPTLGNVVLIFFVLLALFGLISIVLLFLRLEKPLVIPEESDSEAYSKYLLKLKTRLMKNDYLKKSNFDWNTGESDTALMERALNLLDEESGRRIRKEASAVFITTSVSQNGSLDSIFVFVTAIRVVWRIAMLYNQRPVLSDMTKLYANVFGTVLLARQIDDLDLVAEQLEPVISSLFGGTVGTLVPGASYVVSFVVDSILEGSINTLLILRVGLVTQIYCRAVTRMEKRTVGKSATVQACGLLGLIISENSKRIADALFKAIRNATSDSFHKSKRKFTGAFERMFSGEAKDGSGTAGKGE